MVLVKGLAEKKLWELWNDPSIPVLDLRENKYVVISDIHLGDGGKADDFRDNEETLEKALAYYEKEGYQLILLGDVEEFWLFNLAQIVERYKNTIYKKIRAFGDERVHRIFGNHDVEWGTLEDPAKNDPPKIKQAVEAVKMRDINGELSILLTHGHQGSKFSDKSDWIGRFFVRLLKPVKPMAKKTKLYPRRPSANASQITQNYEQVLYEWARHAGVMLICGHTHRAIFASQSYIKRLQFEINTLQSEIAADHIAPEAALKKIRRIYELNRQLLEEKQKRRDIEPAGPNREPLPCYFNSGCTLYNDGMTSIELEEDEIRLIKWQRTVNHHLDKEIYNQGSISEFVYKIRRSKEALYLI